MKEADIFYTLKKKRKELEVGKEKKTGLDKTKEQKRKDSIY